MRQPTFPIAALLFLPAAAAVAAPVGFANQVTASAPALWYRFSEPPTAVNAINRGSLGSAFNGRYIGGVALGAATPAGDTAAFFSSAANQYLESNAPAPAAYLGNPTFTAEAVVRVQSASAAGGYGPFLNWGGNASGQSVYFGLDAFVPNKMFAGFYNGGLRTAGSTPVDRWVHVVWVRDSAGGTLGQHGGTTLYVDGAAVPLEPETGLSGAPVINVTASNFRIDRSFDFVRTFSGLFDEVALYPRAMAAPEVALHYYGFACRADYDGSGEVNANDISAYINAWYQDIIFGTTAADFDASGETDANDISAYINAWYAAVIGTCP